MKTLKLLATLCVFAVPFSLPAQMGTMLSPEKSADEVAMFLRDIIRMDTTDPPGNESKVAEYIAGVFRKEGIDNELLEPVPGRASLVARIKGDGSKKPVLLMAHEDVVPVDRAHWTVDPFAAVVNDGVLYGRGASDDKSPLAAHMEVMLQLHRSGKKLTRDVIFLAEAGEEAGSEAGMRTIVSRYWDKIACEFALNEGGAGEVKNGKVEYMGIATGEKIPRGVRLVATGSSGHGSVPVTDNAVTHLAIAVGKVGTWETPLRLNETTRAFFSRLAMISSPEDAALFRDMESPSTQKTLHEKMPQFYSMLHTSVVPTILKAGFKVNVVPGEAEAQLDIRALPEEDTDQFFKQMKQVIDDPSVTIVPPEEAPSFPPAPASSLSTPMFAAFEAAQRKLIPGSITIPVMTTGATDSSYLRGKGVNAYGLRVPRTFEENTGVHGNDERIELKYVDLYARFVLEAVEDVGR